MSIKVGYKNIIVLVLFGGLLILNIILGIKVYATIMYNRLIRQKPSLTIPLKKEFLIFPKGTKYSMYYEPKPYSVEVNNYTWATGSATYTINADSLNERFDYPIEKPKDTYRIITLGDSFTFGHFVNTSENWTELLEAMLNKNLPCPAIQKYEVINLGVRGYDLNFASERYKRRGIKYKPDAVIWFINNHHFFVVREIVTKQELQIATNMTADQAKMYQKNGDYFPAAHIAVEDTLKKYPLMKLVEQENASLYDFSEEYSGQLIIIANNISPQYMALLRIFKEYRKYPTLIYSNIPNIDLIPGTTFPDTHPNQLGHTLYAKDIYALLRSNKKILCTL